MIIFDVLVYLAVAKIAVLLLEDAAYAVRGKQSPRRQARARQQAAAQKADGAAGVSAPAGAGRTGSTVAAADGYLAGLIEDATDRARARRRRAAARKRGAQAVDGVVVDVDEQGRWYADCDLCGWSSRPYRIEANAQGAGREHTRTEHPDQYTGQPEPTQTTTGDPAESPAPSGSAGEEETRRPALRVIPGGAQDATESARSAEPVNDPVAQAKGPVSSVVHTDDHTYCQKPDCAKCRPPRFGWRCRVCGQRDETFTSMQAAEAAGAQHTCPPRPARPSQPARPSPVGPPSQADVERMRNDLYGRCAHREVREGLPDQWCDNPGGGPEGPFCDVHKTSGTDAGDDQHHPAARPAVGLSSTTEQLREMTVNLEATGPEEIRAAFTQAAEAAGERAEEVGGVAGVLTEAADRYEGLEMAASTVGHLRDAAEQFASAHAALNSAQEELQAALADFNAKDGQVAEAVADAGGNVASKEVLVG
ncbi:hypothetical protein GA0070606_0005 [Micromonospora citrea]|uniref:Uncharacterized protein n=1 Tax=Micromonospora citrea TaxID=47855 RepID=A0A1C6TPR9_9ACTN|nr:hypothetical protein [Micromonospora citrea]SCL43805.1 hypothetical protein GA0070606_0005 [Micromonospora citrea]